MSNCATCFTAWLIDNHARLGKITPLLPSKEAFAIVLDKTRTLEAAAALGLDVPQSACPRDWDEVEQLAKGFRFPAVLKWADPNAVAGAPHNRIWAFAAGMYDTYGNANNRYPVSALAVVNKTTLSATLANDPGDGSILDLRIYWPNDYSGTPNLDMIRDDLIDADGIAVGRCVKPTFAAISVPAPNPVGAVNPPPVIAANVSPFALTGTATAFGVEEQAGFGQTLSAGTAATSASKGAAFGAGGSTIECFFTCPTVGALQVIFGRGGGQNYLGIAATGKLVTNAVTGATTLVAGKRYHAALVEGPAGTQLYLTNITDSGAGVRDANSTTAVTTKPAACTYYLRHNSSGFAMSGGTLDEVAVWDGAIYSGATYTAPTSPRIGTEADLVALYHLDGDLSEKVAA